MEFKKINYLNSKKLHTFPIPNVKISINRSQFDMELFTLLALITLLVND